MHVDTLELKVQMFKLSFALEGHCLLKHIYIYNKVNVFEARRSPDAKMLEALRFEHQMTELANERFQLLSVAAVGADR